MIPALDDLLSTARVVTLPLRHRFRGVDQREAVVFEGPQGWSEFSPFVEYPDVEAAVWLRAAIAFGWTVLPTLQRVLIPVNATLPAVSAAAVPTVLSAFPGCRTVKVKVAESRQTLADDLARVSAARDFVGPTGRVRVDANGGWTVEEAERAIYALASFELEYVEQPCASVGELTTLRGRIADLGILIAADESVRKADDPLAVARAGAADILVIKAQPLGGIPAALQIVAEAGLPVVVSSALDTSVGLSMGAHLAAAIDELAFDCGLGTAALFSADVTDDPLLPVDGAIPVRRVDVNERLLNANSAPVERRNWWLDRLARCYAKLS